MSDTKGDLLERCRRGDSAAWAELCEQYYSRVARYAEIAMSPQLKIRVSGDDIAQTVFRTLCKRIRRGELNQPGQDLWSLLAKITYRKRLKKLRDHTAEKRSINKQQPLLEEDFPSLEPSPEEVVELLDLRAWLLGSFTDPDEQKVVHLRLEGRTWQEIAREVGCLECTIRATLQRVKTLLLDAGAATG